MKRAILSCACMLALAAFGCAPITVYYGSNSWNFTRLAHVEGAIADQMRAFLGEGAVDVTFSLA